MLNLIIRVRTRLANGSYANEAGISHGVVSPLLNALGWDSSDPEQLVPDASRKVLLMAESQVAGMKRYPLDYTWSAVDEWPMGSRRPPPPGLPG